ncbi:thiamine phosphate synthase [Ovoidimarina sediminis]|uniref:thiamine phosphate synthase n=1 Tax=Ovoidimarina sediminis TaxID=3079856 RepID=UPI00290B81E3|nr:thiamine phosphate synthase [Rhodophyticola sp. MJ-SS7]MDU8944972.1 thiamine phosphate synthase [Rhodophyticola sp. MJ-SS7]
MAGAQEADTPQIYLVTPPEFELSEFPARLDDVLDAHAVACVRLALATRDEDRIARAADAVREVCHRADVACVIDTHIGLAERLGLDGVHLTDGSRSVRAARKALGGDAIVGAFCGRSRHDGMTAGEQGADYVSFGPVTASGLGDGTFAERELFAWWSEMIEVPVVAEGGIDADAIRSLRDVTDFFAIGEEIWNTPDAAQALATLKAGLS